MWIYLLIIITSRITRSYQNDLRADFINQLSELRGWKTLAFIFDKDDSVQPWVTEILISKVLINLNDDFRPSLLEIDAYVYLHNSLALWHRLNRGVADGKVDPLKTFILFLSHHDKIQLKEQQNSELRKLDLILVSNIRHQRLIFQRHRETSTLPQQLNGRFDAINGLDANGMKITKDRSFSFQDQVVDVSAFLHPPTTSACQVGKGLCGRDINMIELMGEKLRFRPRFVKPPNNVKWGSFADGNWTGLVGELQRGAAEIGVANLFLAGPYLPHIEFSYPYGLSCSSFMVPPPKPYPQWRALIRPFDPTLWIVSLLVVFSGGVFLQSSCLLYRYLFKRSANNNFHRFENAMMFNIAAITWISRGDNSVAPVRTFNSFWSLFCFLLAISYRTALIAALSIPTSEVPIDTLIQLSRSGLHLFGYNNLFNQLSRLSHDPNVIEMGKRYRSVPKNQTIIELIEGGDSAFLESSDFLNYLVAMSSKKNRDAAPHVMRQCVTTFPVGIGFTPGSRLKAEINPILQQLSASGLLNYWLQATISGYRSSNPIKKSNSTRNEKKPFSLYNLEGVFFLLLLCYVIDLVVFSLEIVVFKIKKSR